MKDILDKILDSLLGAELISAISISAIATIIYYFFNKRVSKKNKNTVTVRIEGGSNVIVQTIENKNDVEKAINDAKNEITIFSENKIENLDLNFDKTNIKKIKVLLISAQVNDLGSLNVEEEIHSIKEILSNSISKDLFDITTLINPTKSLLIETTLNFKPEILHYAGHSTEEGIIMGSIDNIFEWKDLKNVIEQTNTKCLILNTVNSVNNIKNLPTNVPYIIGMKDLITDKEAIDFSIGFYKTLSGKLKYDEAFKVGKQILENMNTRHSNSPTLIKN